MSGFFSSSRRFVNEPTSQPAEGFWYVPRRYDFEREVLPDVNRLRGLTKSEHLNYAIKRLLLLTMRDVSGYWVEGLLLHTTLEDTVSGVKWTTSGSSVVVGNEIILK